MGNQSRGPTLSDVARAAQVSLATASRALNGGQRVVGPELRGRIEEAARRLGYVPNAHAQALAGGTTSTVGLVLHDITDPYFAAIARGAIAAASDQGSLVMVGSTFRSTARELDFVRTFRAQRVDAIVLAGSGFDDDGYRAAMTEELDGQRRAGGGYAFVSEHHIPGHVVLPDNHGGAAALGRALADLGHRRLAVAGGPSHLTTVQHRIDGFVRGAEAGGVPASCIDRIDHPFSEDGGRAAARELLDGGCRATALFCVSDVMAMGALDELTAAGVAVPKDLSLVGFNDVPTMRRLTPPVSTVRLDLETMGRTAMELALDRSASGFRTVHVPAELVLRSSTAPVGVDVPSRENA
ncbi:LacI family DNA-binding transcriptional regulator [Actinomycetospora termitidis]|uniref:LacI family DNA-binding transcriptional regulator n=1 Tax=Actinomycetospora termitidis TaxID=3053470 RepID=A0ABT7M5V2_9PSEU|nr:LacI family DNA-binding transcriptional regulator [Actinomycetospora sp. Odt1-22]MDL5156016.1 LacI family DNA-binding transcriptional regulator [Actinomycetospora sp. Odt1-22]